MNADQYINRTCKFTYHGSDRSVAVEKVQIKGGFLYLTGKDASRDGEYRTFKFLPEHTSLIAIH